MRPAVEIESPPWVARPYGLFSVVDFGDEAGPARWVNGATFDATSCSTAGLYAAGDCADDEAQDVGLPRVPDTACGFLAEPVSAFTVYGGRNGTPGFDNARTRAVADLIRKEQAAVEHAMWITGITNYAYPTQATLVAGTFTDVRLAVASLEAYAAAQFGGVGVIHIGTYWGSVLAKDLVRQGQQLVTPLGTPVVVGAGYTTDDEASSPVYITPQLVGRRNPPSILQVFDTGQNNLETYAERDYLLGYEPCGVGYVELPGAAEAPAYIEIGENNG